MYFIGSIQLLTASGERKTMNSMLYLYYPENKRCEQKVKSALLFLIYFFPVSFFQRFTAIIKISVGFMLTNHKNSI